MKESRQRRHWNCHWATGRRRGSYDCEMPSFADGGGNRTNPSSWTQLALVAAAAAVRRRVAVGGGGGGGTSERVNQFHCRYRYNCCCCCSYCAVVMASLNYRLQLLHLQFSARDGAIWLEHFETRPEEKKRRKKRLKFFVSSATSTINNVKHFVCQNNQSRCYPEAPSPTYPPRCLPYK